MDTPKNGSSYLGHVGNGPAKLPGLTFIFLIYLWVGVVLYFVCACAIGYLFFSQKYYFPISIKIIIALLSTISVFFALLCLRAAIGISGRHENTPSRCQFVLILNFVGGIIWLLFTIWDATEASWSRPDPWSKAIPMIVNILYALVICEAWRRYFATSRKVKAVFGGPRIQPADEAAAHLEREENNAAGEMGLVVVFCWLALVYRGIQGPLYLMYTFFTDASMLNTTILRLSVSSLAGIVAPLLIIYAIKARKGARHLVFWGLGLWLGVSILNYLIFTGALLSSHDFDTSIMLQARFPSMINAAEVVALAVWWYMAVSEKARAWFEETVR